MKSLFDYIINIFEGSATGIKPGNTKNIEPLEKYFSTYFTKDGNPIPCIYPDTPKQIDEYPYLTKWIIQNNDIGAAYFFLKNNGNLCCYNDKFNVDDKTLKEQYGLTHIDGGYKIDGIKALMHMTHKAIGTAQLKVKTWPSSWKDTVYEAGGVVFGKQHAYKVKADYDKIIYDFYEHFKNEFGEYSPITSVFSSNDIKANIEKVKDDADFVQGFANVLSEPLAILYAIKHLIEFLNVNELKKIDYIYIPISQNYKSVDFYCQYENVDTLEPISVKSLGNGNVPSILGPLKIANLNAKKFDEKEKELLKTFLNKLIPEFYNKSRVTLTLPDELKNEIGNSEVAIKVLSILSKQLKNNSHGNALIKTFEDILDDIYPNKADKDDFYDVLNQICKLNGTNTVEKLFVYLFKLSETCMKEIKDIVLKYGFSTIKININTDGTGTFVRQNESAHFNIKIKGSGTTLIFKQNKKGDVTVSKGNQGRVGQFIGGLFG